jgi:hypothetical protein
MATSQPFSLKKLTQAAILLRCLLALFLHFIVSDEYLFAPDQTVYHADSEWLAHYWWGDVLVYPPRLLQVGPHGYFYVVAALYSVFGAFSIIPKLVNGIVGGLTVPIVYDVASRMSGSKEAAERAAKYFAYFPSLILWSALNIRDAWVILLILLICQQALVLQDRFRPSALFLLAFATLSLTTFRDYIFFAVTAPMAISFLVRNRRHFGRNLLLGALVGVVVIYGDKAAGSQRALRTIDFEELQYQRQWNTVGANSSFGETVDISSPEKAAIFLPVGLVYFLLAPFPWTITGIRQALTLPEMLFFYSLMPSIVRGILVLIRTRLSHALMALMIAGGLTFGYALGEGNAGTAYRHRAQVVGFFLIFAAVGVEAKARARREALARSGFAPGLRTA